MPWNGRAPEKVNAAQSVEERSKITHTHTVAPMPLARSSSRPRADQSAAPTRGPAPKSREEVLFRQAKSCDVLTVGSPTPSKSTLLRRGLSLRDEPRHD